jgi:hypothetical protein
MMTMNKGERSNSAQAPVQKTPYQKPAFLHESVFETSALSCGKVQSTQAGCHSNRKIS